MANQPLSQGEIRPNSTDFERRLFLVVGHLSLVHADLRNALRSAATPYERALAGLYLPLISGVLRAISNTLAEVDHV